MNMTLRQRILKMVYPLLVLAGRRKAGQNLRHNTQNAAPPVSFYSLSATLSDGKPLLFETLRGRKVLLVNTASDCGYTAQYAELQTLYRHSKEDVAIIAFPANDFKEQEKGSDAEIATFCSRNFGVSFPLARKAVVVKTPEQHPVFRWLSDKAQNGWNDKAPSWNFSKYLVNEEGILTHYFEPAVSPLDEAVLNALR